MSKVLLIEDEPSIAKALKRMLELEGHETTLANDAEQGLAAAAHGDFQVVVTDWKMPGSADGMQVIKTLHERQPNLPVILMTGQHTTEAAIEAMKFGAYDYIVKPPEPDEFIALITKAVESTRLLSQRVDLSQSGYAKDAIIGTSRAMQNVYKEIGRVAAMPVTVLIRGETGTGKELVARAIYQHSHRSDKPFIEVNCVAIPENLLESELFGHEVGSFTDAKTRRIGRFEQANNGTIFLDEIGDMSLNTQAKLLRVLQNRTIQRLGGKETIPVDVRVLAATHRNLESAILERQFRDDLYHRLNDAIITVPPLRERREDVPDLTRFFIKRYAVELGSVIPSMPTDDALRFLQDQPWPGNVRELRNVVRKALLLARGYPISLEIVTKAVAQAHPPRPAADQSISNYISELLLRAKAGDLENVQLILNEAIERELYAQAMRLANGDQTKIGTWIGVSRPTIQAKLLKLGIHPSQEKAAA